MKITTKFWIALGALAVLSPLGLLLPHLSPSGGAWGEWAASEFKKKIGYVPREMAKLDHFWKSPLPDYAPKGWAEKGMTQQGLASIISAVAGLALIVGVTWLIGKCLLRKGNDK